eukprot:6342083-Amphidinium_carterae.2
MESGLAPSAQDLAVVLRECEEDWPRWLARSVLVGESTLLTRGAHSGPVSGSRIASAAYWWGRLGSATGRLRPRRAHPTGGGLVHVGSIARCVCRGEKSGGWWLLSPWFALKLDEERAPWAFCKGLPYYRTISSLEVFASLFAIKNNNLWHSMITGRRLESSQR